ncbi:MAG: dihydrodipicolinate synthase family protein [Deltaproteobacteria bacterium]|nr:dihydrodipicolinate synthase family protein [Deltaproteobacteria bacterium]
MHIQGVIPALLTPFSRHGLEVDFEALEQQVNFLLPSGVHGLLILGTTSEGPSLSLQEKKQVIDFVGPRKGNTFLLCGTSTSSLTEALELSQHAHQKGAQGLLLLPPFYFKEVSAEGLLAFFRPLFQRVSLPMILYNIPQLSGVEIQDPLIEGLSSFKNLYGVKDTSGQLQKTLHYLKRFPSLKVYCGADWLIGPALSHGAAGSISALANVFPEQAVALFEAHEKGGDTASAQATIEAVWNIVKVYPLQSALKFLLHLRGLKETFVRPPLRELTTEEKQALEKQVKGLGLI